MKDQLIAFFGKTLNMSADAVTSLLTEDGTGLKPEALATLLEADKKRIETFTSEIATLKVEKQTAFDNGHKKATAEVMDARDSELRTRYGIKSQAKGLDLINEIVGAETLKAGKDVTEDQVKQHKTYQDLLLNSKKEKDDAIAEVKGQMDKMKQELERKETFNRVKSLALAEFEKLNPVQNPDAVIAENQRKRLFLDELEGFDYDVDASGNVTVKKDGKIHVNEHQHPISFADVVKGIAVSNFGLNAADDRDAPGGKDKPKPAGGNGTFKVTKPKDKADFLAQSKKLKEAGLKEEEYSKNLNELVKMYESLT